MWAKAEVDRKGNIYVVLSRRWWDVEGKKATTDFFGVKIDHVAFNARKAEYKNLTLINKLFYLNICGRFLHCLQVRTGLPQFGADFKSRLCFESLWSIATGTTGTKGFVDWGSDVCIVKIRFSSCSGTRLSMTPQRTLSRCKERSLPPLKGVYKRQTQWQLLRHIVPELIE